MDFSSLLSVSEDRMMARLSLVLCAAALLLLAAEVCARGWGAPFELGIPHECSRSRADLGAEQSPAAAEACGRGRDAEFGRRSSYDRLLRTLGHRQLLLQPASGGGVAAPGGELCGLVLPVSQQLAARSC